MKYMKLFPSGPIYPFYPPRPIPGIQVSEILLSDRWAPFGVTYSSGLIA